MRKLIITAASLFIATSLTAQVELRMSDRMILNNLSAPISHSPDAPSAKALRAAALKNKAELIVRFSDTSTLEMIKQLGATIVNQIGDNIAIVSSPASLVEEIAACQGVTGLKVSRKVKPTNMEARAASNVDKIQRGEYLEQPYDGSGVVVGMYDIGVDPNHINFRDTEGNSRVSRLWHYYNENTACDTYDTPEKISLFETDYTSESHGTHVLGIISGNFSDPNDPEHDYHGIAPGADIAVAAGLGYEAQIVDGIERISKYAQEQNKPCVINISFGDNVGPHDGTDEFTESINNVAKKYGSIICMSVGNERDYAISLIKEATEDDPQIRTLLLPGLNNSSYANLQSFGTIEIYGNDETPFKVYLDIINRSKPAEPVYTLELPEKTATYLSEGSMLNDFGLTNSRSNIISSGTPFQEYYHESFVGGTRSLDNYNKRYHAQINAYLTGATDAFYARYFIALRIVPETGKKAFAYCDPTYMNFGNKMMPGFDVPDGNGTNSNMGSGPYTIAVGSYVTACVEDSPYTFGKVGDISWFSSYGETPDGRFQPFVCAPGQVIISSRSSYIYDSSSNLYYYPKHYSYKDPKTKNTYHWTSCAGTSQASPHLAGIIALWLSANPDLTLDDIKDIITKTSAAPTDDNAGWGAGRVDAYKGLKMALGDDDFSGIRQIEDNALVNISGGVCEAYIPGSKDVSISVYDFSGRSVATTTAVGDTAKLSLSDLAPGIYIVRASSSRGGRTLKIVI